MALADERVATAVGKIQIWRGGHGRPVLYLHSATGEGGQADVLEFLCGDPAGFEVVAPVFPGFGESEGIDNIDDIEDCAFHLLDVLDVLGLAAPAVVGTSLGGWMAAELACRYPERVSSLVLINPAGLWIEGAPIGEIFGRRPDDLAEALFADQSHPLAQVMHQLAAIGDDKLGDIPFAMLRPTLAALQATAKVAWNPYLHNPKLAGRLRRITAPTLVIHGTADALIPFAHSERYAALIPGARLAEVAGGGHLVTLEQPAPVAQLIREHLEG